MRIFVLQLTLFCYCHSLVCGDTKRPLTSWRRRISSSLRSIPRGGGRKGLFKVKKISNIDTNSPVMPTLFGPDQSQYDRYAACLAATDGLRRIRDSELATNQKQSSNDAVQKYIQSSVQVLNALGMSLSEFNDIGRELSQDAMLKEKVLEQAQLYRMATTVVDTDKWTLQESTPKALASNRRLSKLLSQDDTMQSFCQSVATIEKLRTLQLDRLASALKLEKMPSLEISDPNLLPFLSPKVRAVIEAFPFQAEAIVKQQGLDPVDFNSLLDEMNTNTSFRYTVHQTIKTQQYNS